MDELNLNNLISKFTAYRAQKSSNNLSSTSLNNSSQLSGSSSSALQNSLSSASSASQSLQFSTIGSSELSVYIKDLMKLPHSMNELIYMMQNNLTQMQLNRLLYNGLTQKNLLTQTQAQILAQLQGLSTAEIQNVLKTEMNTQIQSAIKALQISDGGMINLSDLAALIKSNGKDAIAALIITMANAAKQGVNDLSQLKDTAKLVNIYIALASSENPQQILKTVLLLYLPWLPLQEGTDFDLEIKTSEDESERECILVVTITTLNFGNIVATLILETANSVHISVVCCERFPKDELMERIGSDSGSYSVQPVVSFTIKDSSQQKDETQTKQKISMSTNYEVNPYLLLMAHSIIRNTIVIDNNASNGIITHTDIQGE